MSEAPKYQRTMLCLANSRRPGGRCVAGKEFANGVTTGWLRPIHAANQAAIWESDLQYRDGALADVLDIVSLPFIEAMPHDHHQEDHRIAVDYYWTKSGRATWQQVVNATDNVTGTLWPNNEHSYHGTNDKVLEAVARIQTGSLLLINPALLDLVVGPESQYGGGTRRRVRASFQFNNVAYNFVVTDPWIEDRYFAGQDGTFRIATSRLCISLPEVINGAATKLVAAVITPDRI